MTRPSNTTGSEDYTIWRTQVAKELHSQHGIALGIIPEGVWTRLYVKGMTPDEAAITPEVYNYVKREPGERLRK